MFITNHPAMLVKDSLVITDVHLGITRELYERGVSMPSQVRTLAARVNKLKATTKARQLVILGDVKHNIPNISWQERREIPEFLSLLKFRKIVITKGNHDGNIEKLIPNKGKIKVRKSLVLSDYYLAHGHMKADISKAVRHVVIGHNQPHVRFRDRYASYVEPCWVKGRLGKKELIIMPAFNELCGATIVNEQPLIGPVAKKLVSARIYLLDGTDIGSLDDLKKKSKKFYKRRSPK